MDKEYNPIDTLKRLLDLTNEVQDEEVKQILQTACDKIYKMKLNKFIETI